MTDCYWVFKVRIDDDGTESAVIVGTCSPKLVDQKKKSFEALKKEGECTLKDKHLAFFRTSYVDERTGNIILATGVTDLKAETLTEHRLVFKPSRIIKDSEVDKLSLTQEELV